MNQNLSELMREGTEGKTITRLGLQSTAGSEISTELTLPDYLPDLTRVLLLTAKPVMLSHTTAENGVEWEGELAVELLYACPEGKAVGASFSVPFTGQAPFDGGSVREDEVCLCELTPLVGKTAIRPISARRIGLRVPLTMRVFLLCTESAESEVTGASHAEDRVSVVTQCEEMQTVRILTAEDPDVTVSEDLELDGGSPEAKELIACRAVLLPPELRAGRDEAEWESDVWITCLFETQTGEAASFSRRVRIARSLPMPGLTPEGTLVGYGDAGEVRASFQNNSYGEKRILELDLTCSLSVTGYLPQSVPVTSDAYSVAYETTLTPGVLRPVTLLRHTGSGVTVNAFETREKAGLPENAEIWDGHVAIEEVTFAYDPEKRRLTAEGTAAVTLLAVVPPEEGGDGESRQTSGVFRYPFRCDMEIGGEASDMILNGRACVLSQRFRADTESVYADFEIGVSLTAFRETEQSCLKQIALDRSRPVGREGEPLTLFFPEPGEAEWTIAKRYHVTPEALASENTDRTAPDQPYRIPLGRIPVLSRELS